MTAARFYGSPGGRQRIQGDRYGGECSGGAVPQAFSSGPSDICSFATCMPRTGSGTTRRSSRRWKTYYCTGAPARRESCGAAWRAHDNVMIGRSMSGMQQSASTANPVWSSSLTGWSEIQIFGLGTASLAEIAKWVDQPTMGHLLQFWKSLVRLQICIDNTFNDLVCAFDNRCGGKNTHSAYLRVKPHQAGNVWFVVLERVDIQFRSLLYEFFVQLLSPQLIVREPLLSRLCALNQPRRHDGCEAAYHGSRQRRECCNNGCIHAQHLTISEWLDHRPGAYTRTRVAACENAPARNRCNL